MGGASGKKEGIVNAGRRRIILGKIVVLWICGEWNKGGPLYCRNGWIAPRGYTPYGYRKLNKNTNYFLCFLLKSSFEKSILFVYHIGTTCSFHA